MTLLCDERTSKELSITNSPSFLLNRTLTGRDDDRDVLDKNPKKAKTTFNSSVRANTRLRPKAQKICARVANVRRHQEEATRTSALARRPHARVTGDRMNFTS